MSSEITNFRAETASFPNKIDLSWTLSGALSGTESIIIKRSESIYPLSSEGIQIFSTISNIASFFQDENLLDDTFYYYTIFIFDSTDSSYREFAKVGQSYALSYKRWGEGDRLYRLMPQGIQQLDVVNDLNVRKFVDVIGNMMDYYRSYAGTLGNFKRPEKVSENLLDFYSLMFGFPPERGFDLRVLRNLALGLIAVYKRKGTCPGLVDFIKVFTTWDSQCDDSLDLTFKWWDPDTKRHIGYLTSISTNKGTDSNASFTPNIWQNGKFVDILDDPFYTVIGNDATNIVFDGKTPPFNRETGTTALGTSGVTLQDTSKTWTANQWLGYRLYIDSYSTTKFWRVISNTSNELTLNILKSSYGSPEVFTNIDLDVIAASVVEYRLEPEYYVNQGRHSIFYDNTVPASYRGGSKDPAHFFFGGNRSLLSLGQFSDVAVLVIVEGVADYIGRSSALSSTTLTDSSTNFGAVDSLVGKRINPNILQANDFLIVGNTATTIDIIGDMTAVAAAQNNYYIVDEFSSIKAEEIKRSTSRVHTS